MSNAEAAIALFAEPDLAPTPDGSVVSLAAIRAYPARPSEDSWAVRRAIVRARSAIISMRLDDAANAIAQLKRLLSDCRGSQSFLSTSTLQILKASILAAEGDFSASRSVLMSVASRDFDTAAAIILRYLDWQLGERAQICAPDPVDYLTVPVGGKAVYRILNLCMSAALAFDRLHLAVSANLATEALQLARLRYGNHSPLCTLPATLLAQVAYEQGRFEEAEALLQPLLAVMRASGLFECVARASVLLARLSLHRGRRRAALAILRETAAIGRARRWPRLVSIASSEYARTLDMLRCNETEFFENDRMASVVPLERSRGAAHSGEDLHFSTVEAALRRACSAASRGPTDDGCKVLIPWLRIGASCGLRMVFVDAGRPLLTLVERLYYALPTDDPRMSELRPYIATLLSPTLHSNSEESSSISYRPLSRRETGILQMIAHGMSNKRIAQSLGIAPETVKSHAKSIFIKLATRTRAQAVARADAIGLL